MKLPTPFIALGALASACLVVAQNNKPASEAPKTWEEKAAARFGDTPTAEQRAQIEANLPSARVRPQAPRKILVFYRCEGFIHTSIPFANHALAKMGERSGAYQADFADQYEALSKESLANYDALVLNNTTDLIPDESQRAAILEFINRGKGIVGLHAAADNFKQWEEGVALIGGVFNGHPWTAGGTWSFKVEDPGHALNTAFAGKGFWHKDEIYWYRPESFQGREKLRVLLSLDLSKPETRKPIENEKEAPKLQGKSPAEVDVPVSWCRQVGEGRLFFTNLGHNDLTFADRRALEHILDGIQFALKDIDADVKPSAEVQVDVVPAPDQP